MISVIIPTYNRATYLQGAVECVLKQKDVNCEMVIVDDCSSDNTTEIVEKYKHLISITYIKNEETKGPGYSRLLGLQKSSGDYVVFMDDDDYYTDEYFYKKALQTFEERADENLAFVSGNASILYKESGEMVQKPLNVCGFIDGKEYLMHFSEKYNKPQSTFTSVFAKEQLEKAGIYKMRMVNDASIYMRALLAGNAYIMEDDIGVYVIHPDNISKKITPEFLIENLEEKVSVRTALESQIEIMPLKEWWTHQVLGTCRYFVTGTKPDMREYMQVYKWVKRNSGKYMSRELRVGLQRMILTVLINNFKK